MAGIFTKTRFDETLNNQFINQQVNPGQYQLNKNYAESDKKCGSYNGPRQNSRTANSEITTKNLQERSEIENYLYNLDIPTSRTLTMQLLDSKNKKLKEIKEDLKTDIVKDCEDDFKNNYTRLNYSVMDSRTITFNRIDTSLKEQVDNIYYGFDDTKQIGNNRFGYNTRLEAKDSIANN